MICMMHLLIAIRVIIDQRSESILNLVWVIVSGPFVNLLVLAPDGRDIHIQIKLVPNQTFELLCFGQIFHCKVADKSHIFT